MLYLFIFGDNVEDRFGHINYLLLYFIFGLVGGIIHSITTVMLGGLDAFIPAIGASGAVAGILGAYFVFFPQAKIMSIVPSLFFVRLARVPAVIFIGLWFILQFLYIGSMTGVAYMAHIGGFIAGFIIARILKPKLEAKEATYHPLTLSRPPLQYCINCGKLLFLYANFCAKCGTKVATEY